MTTVTHAHPSSGLPAVTLRPAREDDAEQIAGLLASPEDLRQVSPDESFPLDARTVRHWIRERRAGYVLVERGHVVGYAELVQDVRVPDRLWIGHMMVDPTRRGLGLGQRIVSGLLYVAETEQSAREVAISAFEDNPRALRCYRGCGFRDRDVVRVGDRELVELRYRIPGRLPTVPLIASVSSLLLAALASGTLALRGDTAFDPVVAVPLASVVLMAGWGAHGCMPRRAQGAVMRWLRTALYPLIAALGVLAVCGVLALTHGLDFGLAAGVTAFGWVLAVVLLLAAGELAPRVRASSG